jgi:hypothetical protein
LIPSHLSNDDSRGDIPPNAESLESIDKLIVIYSSRKVGWHPTNFFNISSRAKKSDKNRSKTENATVKQKYKKAMKKNNNTLKTMKSLHT